SGRETDDHRRFAFAQEWKGTRRSGPQREGSANAARDREPAFQDQVQGNFGLSGGDTQMKNALFLLMTVLPLAAQPKRLIDAQVQTRAVSGSLDQQIQSLQTVQPQPAWAAYMVPAARGRNFGCDGYWRDNEFTVAGGVVHLEPPEEVMVLFRFNNNQVSQIRTLAPDCDISAGGAPFYWLTGVQSADSI